MPITQWFAKLLSTDRRENRRQAVSRLVAYYWDGGNPTPHRIRDINPYGAFLLTEQRWYPGTVVSMTLQTLDSDPDAGGPCVAVEAKVVRSGADGVGLRFLLPDPNRPAPPHRMGVKIADKRMMMHFLQSIQSNSRESTGIIS
jgi:hypothetical protein